MIISLLFRTTVFDEVFLPSSSVPVSRPMVQIPMILSALKRRKDLKIFTSPWSPPAWMKVRMSTKAKSADRLFEWSRAPARAVSVIFQKHRVVLTWLWDVAQEMTGFRRRAMRVLYSRFLAQRPSVGLEFQG